MWIIGIILGIVAIVVGSFVKNNTAKMVLRVIGVALLILSLIYGGLVLILLGGID